jgi:hypothetical protein
VSAADDLLGVFDRALRGFEIALLHVGLGQQVRGVDGLLARVRTLEGGLAGGDRLVEPTHGLQHASLAEPRLLRPRGARLHGRRLGEGDHGLLGALQAPLQVGSGEQRPLAEARPVDLRRQQEVLLRQREAAVLAPELGTGERGRTRHRRLGTELGQRAVVGRGRRLQRRQPLVARQPARAAGEGLRRGEGRTTTFADLHLGPHRPLLGGGARAGRPGFGSTAVALREARGRQHEAHPPRRHRRRHRCLLLVMSQGSEAGAGTSNSTASVTARSISRCTRRRARCTRTRTDCSERWLRAASSAQQKPSCRPRSSCRSIAGNRARAHPRRTHSHGRGTDLPATRSWRGTGSHSDSPSTIASSANERLRRSVSRSPRQRSRRAIVRTAAGNRSVTPARAAHRHEAIAASCTRSSR